MPLEKLDVAKEGIKAPFIAEDETIQLIQEHLPQNEAEIMKNLAKAGLKQFDYVFEYRNEDDEYPEQFGHLELETVRIVRFHQCSVFRRGLTSGRKIGILMSDCT